MKRLRILLASFGLLFAVGAPVVVTGMASAQAAPDVQRVRCWSIEEPIGACDLGVDKQVSVNGAAFVDADTSNDAASAHIGDTITWKITLSNHSNIDLTPHGKVTMHDALPTGVTFVSATASQGTYDEVTTHDWVINPISESSDNVNSSTLPATLTIVSTANSNGLVQNTATLSDYDPCVDGCLGNESGYSDTNSSNNMNDAWVNIQAAPQVLGVSTTTPQVLGLTNTGTGTLVQSIIAGLFIVSALVVVSWGTIFKKRTHFKLKD